MGHRGACPSSASTSNKLFSSDHARQIRVHSYSNSSTRLEKLTLCSVERDLVQAADIDKIVDRFSALGDNRRILLN